MSLTDTGDSGTAYKADDVLLITGVPGWLGNRMLEILQHGDRRGNYAVSRKIRLLVQPRFQNSFSDNNCHNVEVFYGDITSKETLRAALTHVKTVYHLAGVVYPATINEYAAVNVEGTRNLIDACSEQGVKRFLFMSSDSICGYSRSNRLFTETEKSRPYKRYGKSKYLAEQYLFEKTAAGLINGTSLRGFWFFGPGMPRRNIRFLEMFYWKRQLVFGNGKNIRSISHIDNIVQAFVKAEKSKITIGKWYWIGDRQPKTVNEIYRNIAEGLGTVYKPLYIPRVICKMFSLLDSILAFFGIIHSFIHAAGKFHQTIAGDISAAERDFGYKPEVGFKEIKEEIRETMQKENQKKGRAAATF